MDPIIFTPRLKLTLITKAERGSQELEWLHELRSDEKSTWWSIYGRSKSIEDTEHFVKTRILPTSNEGEEKIYSFAYAVHRVLEPTSSSVEGESQPVEQGAKSAEFIGLVTVTSVGVGDFLPEDLQLPAMAATTTLTVELGYAFLPFGWGKGYATESVKAVFDSCKRATSFWAPFPKLYVRVVVNERNPGSLRVVEKAGVPKRGVYEWTGKAIFIAGEWRERASLHVFGIYLLE